MKMFFCFLFFSTSSALACPLEGAWRTDIDRTAASVQQSAVLSDEKKAAIISILDEFEVIFTCTEVTIRHIGDHDFGGPVPDNTSRYELRQLGNGTVSLAVFDDDSRAHVETATFDATGCFVLKDSERGYEEFKCRVERDVK